MTSGKEVMPVRVINDVQLYEEYPSHYDADMKDDIAGSGDWQIELVLL